MSVTLNPLIEALVATIRAHADDLTELDRAIGDGDHGINMKRGFEAVATLHEELRDLAPGAALHKLGMTLVMRIGGASGPLYGSLFMDLGKALPESPDAAGTARAVAAGVAAVGRRGKSETGEKTMLDVLVPVSERLDLEVRAATTLSDTLDRLIATARSGLESTRMMRATKGRASFLGERSIGHLDPGARSSCLMVEAVCGVLRRSA